MFLKGILRKTTLWTLAFLSLLAGVFVYATIDRTVTISEQLVVVPDTVTSDTWVGVENALVRDVSEYSLYQDFSVQNSAYIDKEALATSTLETPTSAPGFDNEIIDDNSIQQNDSSGTEDVVSSEEQNTENVADSETGDATDSQTSSANDDLESETISEPVEGEIDDSLELNSGTDSINEPDSEGQSESEAESEDETDSNQTPSPVVENEEGPESETESESNQQEINEPSSDPEPQSEPEPEPASEPEPETEPASEPEPETVSQRVIETKQGQIINYLPVSVAWRGFEMTSKEFPLVQAVVTTHNTSTSETFEEELVLDEALEDEVVEEVTAEESEPSFVSPVIESTVDEEDIIEDETTSVEVEDSGSEVDQISETGSSSENVTEEVEFIEDDSVQEEVVSSDDQQSETVSSSTIENDPISDNEETATITEEFLVEGGEDSVMSACENDSDCRMYSTIFDGFTMPEFESGHFLTAAQLRLSLAAQTTSDDPSEVQRYVVEYTYGVNEDWQVATIIDIEDEISNSINGGNFLVSLERPLNQKDISLLKVRVSYQGNIEYLERAYIEGVWLEVTSSSFYEEVDPQFDKDSLDYERDLKMPELHDLNNSDLDPSIATLPSFTMSYSPQQNFLKRVWTSIVSDNQYQVDRVTLKNYKGEVVEVPVEVVYHDQETWSIQFKKQPQKLLPGKYTLEVAVKENDDVYVDSFEFYWGVLAVNTTKSMYFPDETVDLNLAALTDKGDTICDAKLELKITSPSNTFYEVPVEQSGHCGKNNVTDVPDYLASFKETNETGLYTIQLQHLNKSGEVVHKIRDSFEVREYIPYDIERTAPTRIYPPVPYDVTLNIKANRSFNGDIVERVPRGFVIEDASGAELITLPSHTELVWRDVELEEGERLELSYRFDAPNISPYTYLLGPLNMDGFKELRQWQIASDALNAIGWFTGTRTVADTNLNAASSPLEWSTSSIDSFYFTHSTSSDSHQVTFDQAGDYLLAVNLPQERGDGNNSRTRVGVEVRVNGVSVPEGLGRSGYIRNAGGHQESSSYVHFMLNDINEDDYVEVFAEGLTTIDAGDVVNVTDQASLYLENISTGRNVFAATTTQTTSSTSLSQLTAYPLEWTETRQDTGFIHSDSVNPEDIIISSPGTYFVTVNIPLTGDSTQRTNVMGKVLLDGVEVSGGVFSQGYIRGSGQESDADSSIHWSGVVVATTSNQVLTVTAERESDAGTDTTILVTSGFVGSIFIEELPTDDVIALTGIDLVAGTDWDTSPASEVEWDAQLAYDSSVYTHSTSSNVHEITVEENGSYFLAYNDAMTSTAQRANNRIVVEVNGSPVSGAETKSHYIRNGSPGTHNNSSASLVYLLENLTASDVITVTSEREAANATTNDVTPASILLWKKLDYNQRASAPTTNDIPFDNIRLASSTPYFEFSSTDPDGSADLQYQFSISTSSSFTASTTRTSGTDSGFVNTASSTDTSPFVEGDTMRFELQSGDALDDGFTYYWRVRAKDVGGSDEFGEWSVTQSLTVDMAATADSWYQTGDDQFAGGTLVGSLTNGAGGVEVDLVENSEILLAYGEGTETAPRYRFWNGSNWGTEQTAVAVSNTINWVKTAAGVTRDEYVMVTLDQSNDAFAQVYNASSSSWGDQTLLSDVVVSPEYRGIAVGYESVSGDAVAISCTNGPHPVYRIWDGSSWSATSSITVSSLNDCNFLQIASDPISDEMILVVRDTGSQFEALVWDGDSFVDSNVMGSVATVQREGIAVEYETSGEQAIIAVSDNTGNRILYSTWDGTSFSSNYTHTIGNDFTFGNLIADPDSDNMALCYIDRSNDIGVLRWDGGVWSTFLELDTSGNNWQGRPVDCEFETVAGRDGNIMVPYSDTANVRYQVYDGDDWSGENTISGITDSFWMQTERADDGTIVAVNLDDIGDSLESTYFNGTSWDTKTTIESSPSSVISTPYEMYDMSAKRFQFSQGTVTSPPIDFTDVPAQPTWGDLSFSTTEPLGTDVSVRFLYTSTTTCDAYIPNGDLSGNTTGFTSTSSPVDISSLSTTTYSQICLEATVSAQGSASASLDDWQLSWVRESKVIQNNYQWYVNGSFLTPTDPWPSGAVDLDENTPTDADTAISLSSVTRLRMSLLGSNVDLATSSDTFKLQYAAGFTCSPSLSWEDVGDVSSTTALWRGYENSIVGSDWYDGDWSRRIKITVSNSVVEEGVTDFPVYVDLSNLPSGFFGAVQSDGDDIRITEDDGLTELPFELVAIDTGAKTGELHFKADLASTTDTEFYIYYDNSGASGYSASATYGSENVWTNNFDMRHALDDSPVTASPQFKDSTNNDNHAVAYAGMTAGDVVTGQIGEAIALDGNDGGTFQSALGYTGEFTASMWWNSSGDGFAIAGPTGANEKLGPWSSNNLFARTISSSDTSVTSPTDGTWAHVVLTRDSSNKVDVYVNGVRNRLYGDSAQSGTSDWRNFGGETSQGFTGTLDELRFADVKRSTGWVKTEFNNQSNPTGFYTVSAEELISNGKLLPSTLLADSDNAETYVEFNPTRENQSALLVGDDSEWDFVLQNNDALAGTDYCFRMVYEDGSLLSDYVNYPRMIANAPPLSPTLSAPFDNEQTASTTPWFEFTADDNLNDEVSYQIQVDTDVNFGSPDIDKNSVSDFALFTNLSQQSEKSQFTPSETVRFVPTTALSDSTTYWWRVRAADPDGSDTYGDWSTPKSVTIDSSTTITTWYQTTGDQFATNNLVDTIHSVSTNDTGIDIGFTVGTSTGTDIDFNDVDTGNAWGDLSFSHNVSSGSITYYVEYLVSGSNYELIPDVDLAGNSSGFTSSPVSLVGLDTEVYDTIRIVAVFAGNSTLPRLLDWTVTWSETIEIPTHVTPFDNAKVATTSPSFTFYTTDPEDDDLQYEFQLSSTYDFAASSTFTSGVDSGFANLDTATDTSAFNSGDTIEYTAQSVLSNGNTYWWRVRARDPGGGNAWSKYSNPESFTIDTSITTSVWHQTTGEQFATDNLTDIETTAGGAQITSIIRGVMVAYGEATGQAPQYRLWNGAAWSDSASAETVNSQISWLELKASPTRPEYALGTLGTDSHINFQIYNAATSSWGNLTELYTNSTSTKKRTFDLSYETSSGDLMAVVCDGSDAFYSIWDGSTWSATSSISLNNTNDCEYVKLASDPVSDEILAVFRHTNTGATDFEAMVWNGSSWGNGSEFGNIDNNTNEGMAVAYEESGDQAIVAVSNQGGGNTLQYNIWDGGSWSGTSTHALGDRIEVATMKADDGTDSLALCYIDNDRDIGVLLWDGSAWNTFTELDVAGNAASGRPVDCEFETEGARDGYLMVAYSDTGLTNYQYYNGITFSGETPLDIITDTFEDTLVRAADGIIHLGAYNDALNPDRLAHSRWNGSSWSARERFSESASLTGLSPYNGGLSLAPQVYPNFTTGSIRTTAIDFDDGTGPRWEEVTWNDTTPGASSIVYRVYYESSPDTFTLVPDVDLSGNSTGFTSAPIDISALDRTIYNVLQIDAEFLCDSGDCPTLEDLEVSWAEGIEVSGNAYEYDGTSTTTSGTVAVAVNGVLQAGKTGSIAGDGTWSIANVTAFSDDTVTIFIDAAAESDESTAIATYNGVGNITGLELRKRHLTIGGDSSATTTNSGFAGYDNSDDEDIFFAVDGSNNLTVCVEATCSDGGLKIVSGATYMPGAGVTTDDILNEGSFQPATNTVRVAGQWSNQGEFIPDTSTVIFTATTSSTTLLDATSTHSFYNVTFGETSGSATWNIDQSLQLTGSLVVNYGTLNRATSTINVAQNLQIGSGGDMTGLATTTFDGSGSHTWSDAKASTTSSNVGYVVIDGTSKTITLGGHVAAETVTIGADDTLNASGSGYNINVYGDWLNNNSFIPQSGTVTFVGTSTVTIDRGASSFNNLAFSGVGGSWSFVQSSLPLSGDLSIATGTVTLPTGTTTIGGSFNNTGGTFLHNNGEVRMTSSSGGKTIAQSGTTFLNAFYDLVFTGSGAWSYTETNATTTNDMRIQAGTVTFPSGTLTVGANLSTTDSGAFVHNGGEVVLLVQDSDEVSTNGSDLNDVRVVGGVSSSWYGESWPYRVPVTINASEIDDDLTDFPVYVDMDNFASHFFSNVKADGGDIRVTENDGTTEVPRELVSISTGSENGELHFKATSLSSTTDTTFYIYYGNSEASDYADTDTYGAENVWSNGFVITSHMNDLTTSSLLNSVDSSDNGTKVSANNPVEVSTGKMYEAQDNSDDHTSYPNVGGGASNISISGWFNADDLTGSGDNALYGFTIFSAHSSGNYTWLTAGGTGNGGSTDEVRFCGFSSSAVCNVSTGANIETGKWHYISATAVDGGQAKVRVDGVEVLSFTSNGGGVWNSGSTIGDLRSNRNIEFEGRLDEIVVSNVIRSVEWQDATYRNQATTTDFYTVSGYEVPSARNFTDTNTTVLGDLDLEAGGDTVFPTGVLSVGGSFTNSAEFDANNGTVKFDSTAGAETIAVGSSTFATLEFDSATGDFTVTENATATVAINLVDVSQFTQASGTTLTSAGTFTNLADGANTTWTDSTLLLLTGGEVSLNAKAHAGDVYGNLYAASNTLAKMWNSSADTYTTTGTTSAIYSQDHSGVDGDLNIYGNYTRTTGIEYWNQAIDFDGADLTGSERQVDVKIASSSSIDLVNASWSIVGSSTASTTVDAVSGAYSITADNATINAEYFSISNTDNNGLNLTASTTLTTFTNGYFDITPGLTGITVDASTVDTNPAGQFFYVGFATSTPGLATNVTLSGSPSSFIWFREGSGNHYGETFDAGDGDPGSIRFDDSSFSVTVSGVVYSDDGSSTMGVPTCDDSTPNVRIVVDGGSYASSTSCSSVTGAYSFGSVAYIGDPNIVVYLDTGGGEKGSVVTKTVTSDVTDMDIYANRVIVRHEDVSALTIADMVDYDNDDDTDLSFVAATGTPDTLILSPNTELFVFASSTFAPGGNITLGGNGNTNSYEGTLALATSSAFVATGTETHTLAGRLVVGPSATLTSASSTFVFNATTTGKSISASDTITFNELQFNGVGGGWNIGSNLIVLGDVDVTNGTVTGTGDITLPSGSISGNGVLSLGGGTVTLNQTNTLGGTSAWTFNDLVLGDGTIVGTTTPASTATTTILGTLTIANAHFLDAGNSVWDFAGTGTVFTETGTLLEDTSTIRFSGAGSNVPSTNYYDLHLDAGAGSPTYSGVGSGILVQNDLKVGGTANSTFDIDTNDPVLQVDGNVLITANGTLSASDSATTTVLGNWTNQGTFTGNSGLVEFTSSVTASIDAGASAFSNVSINGTGDFTVTDHATSTGDWLLQNHNNFTLSSGQTLAVGGQFDNTLAGADTTWSTSTTLYLYGNGTYSINASTTNDTYSTLAVGPNTQVRMWNSDASTYDVDTAGSLYSQDHADTAGDLYIWGQLVRTSGSDYWSYATDFDGTDLSGGNERVVEVYLASSTSATWAGGSLSVIGSTTATTTLQNQGGGYYALTFGSGATTNWSRAEIRDIDEDGVTFAGTPTVTDFSYTDHLVTLDNATAITVGGTAIDQNPAKNFTDNIFEVSGGPVSPANVTATGTSVSSWRYTNHSGSIAGEASDEDPDGDPGYLVWDDSAALITVSGNVYSDEGSTASGVCDDVTNNVTLTVAGLTSTSTSCDSSTGAFSIPNVAFGPADTLTLYIDGETEKAANVSADPISSIGNMHLYEDRVIVRHENTDPLTIADMAVWDSSDDADIPFTAVDAGSDTLTLPADTKLLIWSGKTFEPNGDVTLSGGGAGAAEDGTLEAQSNATFTANDDETHSIGGSLIFDTDATLTSASSTIIMTTSDSGRTVDVNEASFNNLSFTGSGSWSVTDAALSVNKTLSQTAGTLTLPTGTTTIGGSINMTGGSFTHNGSPFEFTATSTGNIVRFDDSETASLLFTGNGSWSMTDANATTTGSFTVASGTVLLPSGNLAIGQDLNNQAGTITHNTANIIMTATSSSQVIASSSDLYSINFVGGGAYTFADEDITFLDSFTIASGSVTMASGTTAVGGSFTANNGSFYHSTGTVLMNSGALGKTLNSGTSPFYDLQIGAPSGGYTVYSATTTNNLTLASASAFTVQSGAIITVGGVFTNSVGGVATTWTDTSLILNGQSTYSINTRSDAGDTYGTLTVGADTDISAWYSNAATTTVATSSSLYSQDHANVNGDLYIYGDLTLGTTTNYWNYTTDFDGTDISGSPRQVDVYIEPDASISLISGTLEIQGSTGFETAVQSQSGLYSFVVNGGALNADYYSFDGLDIDGLQLIGLSTVTNLANGYFDIATTTAPSITLSSTTLNANPSKIFDNVGFNATGPLSGFNVNLVGSTTNAWRFTNSYGNIGGEGYDIDGLDACGSIRFDDSSCLLTEQTHYRWRADDGGEGAPDSEWFDSSWDSRQSVSILNNDNTTYATTAVKVNVTYDAGMKSDFSDLRFTTSDGLTETPFWLEKHTASTDAEVWVQVPSMPASDFTRVYMYYGSSTATSTSDGDAVFTAFDDYEDNNISEYSGDTSLFNTAGSPVYGGSYSVKPVSASGKTTDGIFRFDQTVSQGEIIRYMQYVDTTLGTGDEPCTLFGVQSPGTTNQNYAVCLEQFGTDRISLAKDVQNNDTSGTVLATSTVTYSTGWYEVEVDWQTDDTIDVSLFNSGGTLVATTSATDSSYSSGGYGYAFWYQSGAWDGFVSYDRITTKPTVYIGAKQGDGGANWAAALDTAGNAIFDQKVRLRLSVENSGLDITGQQFLLEYAEKGAAPTCESVSAGSFASIPNQASCGSSPVCMATSSNVSNGDSTTNHLLGANGTFSAGKIVTSPSVKTSSLDVDQNYYTELEYALVPTINATDSLCFRVTNNGTDLDFYGKVPELGLSFDPSFGAITLNEGMDISLLGGTTTEVYATGTVTDLNGYADITHGTATIYRSGAGAACSADNNNCYILSTENGACSFTDCAGDSCTLSCVADVYFHADPTDADAYEGEEWLAYMEAEDNAEGYDFASAPGVELLTLRSLTVDSTINYGSLTPNSDTGSYNPTTTITNLGNVPIDVDVEGGDLSNGYSSTIPADQQKVATSTFTYNACPTCVQLSSSSPVTLDLNMTKPTSTTPAVETEVFWGISVPFTAGNSAHTGNNTFTAIGM